MGFVVLVLLLVRVLDPETPLVQVFVAIAQMALLRLKDVR